MTVIIGFSRPDQPLINTLAWFSSFLGLRSHSVERFLRISSLSTRIHSGCRIADLTASDGCCVTWNGESQRFESDWLLFCWRFGQKYSPLLTAVSDSRNTHIFFFARVCPFSWKKTVSWANFLTFGFYWTLPRVANLVPSPSYIIFLFSKFLFTFAFHLLPFPFHFLFFSNSFLLSCHGYPTHAGFTHMGPSFARYTPSMESRPAAWSWHSSLCGYAHSHLRFCRRSG